MNIISESTFLMENVNDLGAELGILLVYTAVIQSRTTGDGSLQKTGLFAAFSGFKLCSNAISS